MLNTLSSCYTVDKKTGLKAIPNTPRSLNLNQTTSATGPAGSASHLVFSEDGKQLMASVKGVPPSPGMIAIWDVAEDDSLSADVQAVAPPAGGLLPLSMTVIPGKNAVRATDLGVGFDVFDLGGGNASAAVAIHAQSATCWSSLSTQTGNFYLTDIGTAIVTEVHVDDDLQASIVKVSGDLTRALPCAVSSPGLVCSNTPRPTARARSTTTSPRSTAKSVYPGFWSAPGPDSSLASCTSSLPAPRRWRSSRSTPPERPSTSRR